MCGSVPLLLAIVSSGCSDLAEDSPLAEARKTPEALAEVALEALRAGDADGLASLVVSRQEYEGLIWPVLPDRNYVPLEFAWGMKAPRTRKARRKLLEVYGGLPLELVRVDLGEEREAYDEFVLYREARMTVRRSDTGQEGVIPLMDVLIEMGGGWKFMNYRDAL